MFDRSVIQFANGKAPSLFSALRSGFAQVLRHPLECFKGKDTLAVYGVYAGTYLAKNYAECVSETKYNMNPFWPMFFATTAANCSLGIMKDGFLARLYARSEVKNVKFPMSTNAFFLVRDATVIFFSFNGPHIVSPFIQEYWGIQKKTSDRVSQLLCPGFSQIIATPVHLLALDFYNRPQSMPLQERVQYAISTAPSPLLARVLRQSFVFGFGGVAIFEFNRLAGLYDKFDHDH